jgi:hypothetical protein
MASHWDRMSSIELVWLNCDYNDNSAFNTVAIPKKVNIDNQETGLAAILISCK